MEREMDMDTRQDKQYPNPKPVPNANPGRSPFKIRRNIVVDHELFYSDAFKSISSASAVRTLLRCLQKRSWSKMKLGGTKRTVYWNDEFIFPYAEAKFLGISTTQFWKNIKTLVDKGFIDIAHQGGWYQKNEKEKDYSRYKLSDRWRDYNTKDFRTIEKAKVLQPDYYIRKNLERKKTQATSRMRSGQLHRNEVDGPKQVNNRLHKSEVAFKPEEHVPRLENIG